MAVNTQLSEDFKSFHSMLEINSDSLLLLKDAYANLNGNLAKQQENLVNLERHLPNLVSSFDQQITELNEKLNTLAKREMKLESDFPSQLLKVEQYFNGKLESLSRDFGLKLSQQEQFFAYELEKLQKEIEIVKQREALLNEKFVKEKDLAAKSDLECEFVVVDSPKSDLRTIEKLQDAVNCLEKKLQAQANEHAIEIKAVIFRFEKRFEDLVSVPNTPDTETNVLNAQFTKFSK